MLDLPHCKLASCCFEFCLMLHQKRQLYSLCKLWPSSPNNVHKVFSVMNTVVLKVRIFLFQPVPYPSLSMMVSPGFRMKPFMSSTCSAVSASLSVHWALQSFGWAQQEWNSRNLKIQKAWHSRITVNSPSILFRGTFLLSPWSYGNLDIKLQPDLPWNKVHFIRQ